MAKSNVLGFIEVRIPKNSNPVDFLEKLATITKNWHWEFSFTEELSEVRPFTAVDYYIAHINFRADGKETFQNNIEQFGRWLQDTEGKEEAEAIAWLEARQFRLMFEYVEESKEGNFVGEGSAYFIHKFATPLGAMKLTTSGYKKHEYSFSNLTYIVGYDDEKAFALTKAA